MSEKHNQLRDLAIAWLKKHNYSDIEIEVKIPNYSGKNYKGSIYSNYNPLSWSVNAGFGLY